MTFIKSTVLLFTTISVFLETAVAELNNSEGENFLPWRTTIEEACNVGYEATNVLILNNRLLNSETSELVGVSVAVCTEIEISGAQL